MALALAAWLAGAFLRCEKIAVTPFGLDEGIAAILTAQLTHGGQFPLTGVKTSLHFYNPPLLQWLLAPAFLLRRDPALATLFVAWLGALAPLALAAAAWRLAGRRRIPAAAALALASLAPFWIEHSRRLWGHALILPFSCLFLLFLVWWILDRRPWALAGAIASAAAAQALHFSGVLLWPVAACLWFTWRPRAPFSWRWAGAGLLIAAFWYGPYGAHLVKTDFLDLRIIAAAATGRSGSAPPARSIRSPGPVALNLLADGLHNDALGREQFLPPRLAAMRAGLRGISVALCLAALILAIQECRRGGAAEENSGAPLWGWGLILALAPVAAFSVARVTFVPAYLLAGAPGVILLAAGAIARLQTRLEAHSETLGSSFAVWIPPLALAIWSVYAAAYSHAIPGFLRSADLSSASFTTLERQREVAAWIVERSRGEPALARQLAHPRQGLDYSYFYLLWARTDQPERFQDRAGWRRLFLIRDAKDSMPGPSAGQLHVLPYRRFGNVEVYEWARDSTQSPPDFLVTILREVEPPQPAPASP